MPAWNPDTVHTGWAIPPPDTVPGGPGDPTRPAGRGNLDDEEHVMPRSRPLARRSMAVALTLALASLVISMVSTSVSLAATTSLPAASLPAASPAAQITVSPAQPLATVPGTAIGINASSYDASLLDRPVPALLRNAGISVVRENGVSNVDWWQIHNGIVTSGDNGAALAGSADYGDYGVLSDGSCGSVNAAQVCAAAAQTPFPASTASSCCSRFIQPGDQLLSTSSSQGLVQVFADRAQAGGGQLRVLLVNDDPAASYAPSLSVPGYRLSPAAPVLFYGPASSAVQTLTGPQARAAAATVAPYSITMLTLTRA